MSSDGGGGGGYFPSVPPFPFNFHLLEVTLISAQYLFPATKRSTMRTYAVAWLHPDRRLRTRLDAVGHTDPTWNDKFVFRVDDATLRSDTSAVQVDIYAARPRFHPSPDILLGTARAVLSTLRPSTATRFVALQVRRPATLLPQGILNLGIALIDAYVRSLPLYADLGASAFSYRDLIMKSPSKTRANLKAVGEVAPAEAVAVMRRSDSGEKERIVLEKKLKKWRSEVSSSDGRAEKRVAETTDEEGSSRGKSRRPLALSCFNLTEQCEEETEENDSSRSSRSDSDRR
ncbi:hypothetical protein HPP92_005114 [Vanilla planifolia]|uniref:C2 domain-containing protein n=1 Tax=Vanilla planifolia TaxID=51239 RepID=A0A835RMW4_VANPL|nr:hypothetical protein HPP92_005114 [Vanilla planifolia]